METQPVFMFSVIWVSAGRYVLIWTSCHLGTANNLKYKITSLQYRLVHIVQYDFMKIKPTKTNRTAITGMQEAAN